MASLDDELALFNAEIASIEVNPPAENQSTQYPVQQQQHQPFPAPTSTSVPSAPFPTSVSGTPSVGASQPIVGAPSTYPLASSSFPSAQTNVPSWAATTTTTTTKRQPIQSNALPPGVRTLYHRKAAGEKWVDARLGEFPKNDYRLFVGDLGNDVHEGTLREAFAKYPSCCFTRVVRDKRTNKSKGYGFVSFMDVNDMVKAFKEMNGKFVGTRPLKIRKSNWQERTDGDKQKRFDKKMRHQAKQIAKMQPYALQQQMLQQQ
eukprot:GCRY01003438.1.p1 GENE.GCRY01003438.1~~GCRY01003438.1.p1  ORF type:complete len:261 (+),score=60.92 GCRY01003438.1:164-946(+)